MDLRATSSIAGFVVLPPFVKLAQRNTLKSVTTGRPVILFTSSVLRYLIPLENSRTISRGIVVETSVLIFLAGIGTFMPTGKVKFYREDTGHGLIERDDGGKDVFVHITSVADPSVEVFREDRCVRYVERVSQRSGNPEAFDVVVL